MLGIASHPPPPSLDSSEQIQTSTLLPAGTDEPGTDITTDQTPEADTLQPNLDTSIPQPAITDLTTTDLTTTDLTTTDPTTTTTSQHQPIAVPLSRVKKIAKLSAPNKNYSQDAIKCLARAIEAFISFLAVKGNERTGKKRKTLKWNDVHTFIEQTDELEFLMGAVKPPNAQEVKRKGKRVLESSDDEEEEFNEEKEQKQEGEIEEVDETLEALVDEEELLQGDDIEEDEEDDGLGVQHMEEGLELHIDVPQDNSEDVEAIEEDDEGDIFEPDTEMNGVEEGEGPMDESRKKKRSAK